MDTKSPGVPASQAGVAQFGPMNGINAPRNPTVRRQKQMGMHEATKVLPVP